jgi:hypothetical protein
MTYFFTNGRAIGRQARGSNTPRNSRTRSLVRWLGATALAIAAAWPLPGSADVSGNLVSRHYSLVGAVFDDGGPVYGSFDLWPSVPVTPGPQIFNVNISTGPGLTLRGSTFTSVSTCYDATKRPICAPGDNLLIYVETGAYGQPGYDRYQFATFFAPNAFLRMILDPRASYEMSCGENGCLMRHIASGVLTATTQ